MGRCGTKLHSRTDDPHHECCTRSHSACSWKRQPGHEDRSRQLPEPCELHCVEHNLECNDIRLARLRQCYEECPANREVSVLMRRRRSSRLFTSTAIMFAAFPLFGQQIGS